MYNRGGFTVMESGSYTDRFFRILIIHYTDVNECQEDLNNCSHFCNNTEGSYECYCRSGYVVDTADRSTCHGTYDFESSYNLSYVGVLLMADINECQDSMDINCSHFCNNTEGSYECYCLIGYVLDDSDKSTCLGMRAISKSHTYSACNSIGCNVQSVTSSWF